MAKKKQVGGTIEVYLELDVARYSDTFKVVKSIEKLGGRVLHAFPPAVIVASVAADKEDDLQNIPGVQLATTGAFPKAQMAKGLVTSNAQVSYARNAWNQYHNVERRLASLQNPELGKTWDEPGRLPLDPPAEISAFFR